MKLYSFFRSSASFRVRIALNLKGLSYEYIPVTLRASEGDQESESYRALNPQKIVPLLVNGEVRLGQSLAILEYLEERHPTPPLFPSLLAARSRVRSLALYIACEMQPLNNLRTVVHLERAFGASTDALKEWRRHWARLGFDALERELAGSSETGRFMHGDSPTAADCFLVPQVFNALRPDCALDVAEWPTIKRIFDTCMSMPEFDRAQPSKQPDAV